MYNIKSDLSLNCPALQQRAHWTKCGTHGLCMWQPTSRPVQAMKYYFLCSVMQ